MPWFGSNNQRAAVATNRAISGTAEPIFSALTEARSRGVEGCRECPQNMPGCGTEVLVRADLRYWRAKNSVNYRPGWFENCSFDRLDTL